MWVDAAIKLALRIGNESGINELLQLHNYEQSRLRNANHVISIISSANSLELSTIEKKCEETRQKLINLSQSILDLDHENITVLMKMEKEIRQNVKSFEIESIDNEVEAKLLSSFQLLDVRHLSDSLRKWTSLVTSVAIRFTSDMDLETQEELKTLRSDVEEWVESGLKMLARNERSTNGKDYKVLTESLTILSQEIDHWLKKIETRISGEDGIASHVISLQNQLEDRYTIYSARDFDKPLPPSERALLKDSFMNWIEHTTQLLKTLSNTTEKEQHKIPIHADNFLGGCVDQITTDTEARTNENVKLHNSMTGWMVQLLIKGIHEKPSDNWDQEFHQLNSEIISFNMNLLRDAGEFEMKGDDHSDLRQELIWNSDKWLVVAKRLLNAEKKIAQKELDRQL